MKAKDLMINDIVMAHLVDGEKAIDFPVAIVGLDENETLVDGTCEFSWRPLRKEHNYIEFSDELKPIPLTKEILEKNGFHLKDDGWYNWYDGINNPYQLYVSIAFHRDTIRHVEIRTKKCHTNYENIQYAHELQHALRLCGLNESADNFKII